jgi:NAD(P)-dependent dehydrogenase (short-subunit alcohol dehydrogenase family)
LKSQRVRLNGSPFPKPSAPTGPTGARVVVSARSRGGYDGAAHVIPPDISTPDGPPRLAAQALEYLGGIDILVDNAASQTVVPDGVLAMTDADWLADLNSSLLSAVRLDRAGQAARTRSPRSSPSSFPPQPATSPARTTSSTGGCSLPCRRIGRSARAVGDRISVAWPG